jgi:PAS domain S-box-containing protein
MNLRVFLSLKSYLFTAAVVAAVVSTKLTLNHWLDVDSLYLLLLGGVAVCAAAGGFVHGTIAAVASITLVLIQHFIRHQGWGDLNLREEAAHLAMFTIDSALVIFVCVQLRKARSFRQKTEGKFRSIFDSNIIGFVMADDDSNIIEANDYYLDLLGITRADLRNGKFTWKQFTPPEYFQLGEIAKRQMAQSGVAAPYEKEYVRANGQRVWVLLGGTKSNGITMAYVIDISARKAAERELAEAKNRLEENVNMRTRELLDANRELSDTQNFLDSMIENIPNMIFVKDAQDLRFIRMNKAGEQLLGYSRLDLLGKNDYDFFPPEEADFFTTKDREVLKSDTVVDIAEEPITTKAGPRYLHTKKMPILGKDGKPLYLLGISEDVTEKKAAEAQRIELAQVQAARSAAERSNRRLSFLSEASAALNESLDIRSLLTSFSRVIVNSMADWCVVDLYDEKDRTMDRMVAISKLGEVPLEVKNWWQRRPLELNAPEGIGYVLRTGKSRVYNDLSSERLLNLFQDSYLARKGEDWNINASMVVPLSYHGKVLGTICFVQTSSQVNYDEFDLSIAQDLAKRAALAIENASLYSKASEASRAKSAFLANISHEIRTPLGAMLGFAELVLDDKQLSSKQEAYITTIARNGRQLLRLVDEILDLSKVESERIQIERLSFSLPSLLKEAHGLMQIKADERGLELRMEGTKQLPERIKADPLRLRQILLNVIGNAIKFTEQGRVTVRTSFLRDSVTGGKGTLRIEIHDTGIGMDDDQRSRIFQPFVQADGTMTRKYGGTGLGLFLSRKLARLMGGDVILQQSSPAHGSEFIVTIGVEVDAQGTPDAVKTLNSGELKNRRNPHSRVLLVDDSADNRMLISAFLASPDIELDQAENGRVGVEKALAKNYDLILMDIQMPEMDGYEAVKQLEDRGYKGTVVALTAHAMKGDRERCLKAGFDDYLCKPVSRKSLMEMLERHSPPSPTKNLRVQ